MQFSHTIPHYIWCNSPIEYPPWSIKKCTLIKWPQTVFDLIRKGGIFCRCNCQSSPLTGSKNRFSFDQSEKKILTGKSLSEALIFASTNPQYDDRLFIELRVQYMKIASSEHAQNMLYTQIVFCFDIQNNLCTQHILSLEFSCTQLVIQWTICRHIVG